MAFATANRAQRIGDFRIVDRLDDGGAGVVYEAVKDRGDTPVALKLFGTRLSENPAFRKRFRGFFTKLAAFEHPHAVPILEAGRSDQGLYVVMRLVRGQTLEQLLADRAIEPREAVELLAPVADALDAARGLGLLHCDVKPRKILVEADSGRALVTGFTVGGPPRSRGRHGQPEAAAQYMSPEQLAGEPSTAAGDIYALAAVVYEALNRSAPSASLEDAPAAGPARRFTSGRSALPAALDDVLGRSLAAGPSERHASAGELMHDLLDVTRAPSTAPAPEPPAAPQPNPAAPAAPSKAEGRPRAAPVRTRARRQAASRQRGVAVLAVSALLICSGLVGWALAGDSRPGRSATATRAPSAPGAAADERYRVALGATIGRLNTTRSRVERRLRTARRTNGQAAASRSLAGAYRVAAASLEEEPAPGRPALPRAIVGRLNRTARAYDAMSVAAGRGDAGAFRTAARTARRHEAGLRAALARSSREPSLSSERS